MGGYYYYYYYYYYYFYYYYYYYYYFASTQQNAPNSNQLTIEQELAKLASLKKENDDFTTF